MGMKSSFEAIRLNECEIIATRFSPVFQLVLCRLWNLSPTLNRTNYWPIEVVQRDASRHRPVNTPAWFSTPICVDTWHRSRTVLSDLINALWFDRRWRNEERRRSCLKEVALKLRRSHQRQYQIAMRIDFAAQCSAENILRRVRWLRKRFTESTKTDDQVWSSIDKVNNRSDQADTSFTTEHEMILMMMMVIR